MSDSNSNTHGWRRWLLNLFRAFHVVGLVGTGAILIGGTSGHAFPLLLLGSGLAMVLLDLLSNPMYFRQVAGAWLALKLLLVTWLVLDLRHAAALFWVILFLSVLLAHAPGRFRHRLWKRK